MVAGHMEKLSEGRKLLSRALESELTQIETVLSTQAEKLKDERSVLARALESDMSVIDQMVSTHVAKLVEGRSLLTAALDQDIAALRAAGDEQATKYADGRDMLSKRLEDDLAKLAESRAGSDALEVFFLCVMLGFHGDWHNKPDKLNDWQRSTKTLILDQQQRLWPSPPEIQPPTFVPPLTGLKRKQSMLLTWALSLFVLIPVAMFFLINRLSQ